MIRSSIGSSARRLAGLFTLAALAASLATPATARAEATAADRAAAEALFEQARAAMNAGRYAEACPLLQKSQELDPGGGTLLNLAMCHEREGRTATAWVEYHDAAAQAARDKREDRETAARKRAAELDAVLSRLTLAVGPDAAPGLEVTRDGVVVPRAAWNAPVPVDPGPHVIVARAPGRAPFEAKVVVGPRADVQRLVVPALAPAPSASAPPSAPPPAAPATTFQRTVGYVLGGVGIVTLGAAAGVGAYALSRDHAARDLCGGDASCPPGDGLDASRSARRAAQATDILLGVGAATLITGVAVVLTAKPTTSTSVAVGPAALRFSASF